MVKWQEQRVQIAWQGSCSVWEPSWTSGRGTLHCSFAPHLIDSKFQIVDTGLRKKELGSWPVEGLADWRGEDLLKCGAPTQLGVQVTDAPHSTTCPEETS